MSAVSESVFFSLPHCLIVNSPDVQYRLAGEVAVDQAVRDRADLAPRRLDRDLRPQFPGRDQLGQQRESDARALDAHQLVKQCEAVKPRAAGTEEFATLESGGAGLRHAESDAGAVRLPHAERRAQGRAAERIEDQPERPVWLGCR